ncbi:MAG: poly-beta-1,6 N-acetyl-D-glucosamine export porin PgaA, partial [Herbaspirillum sp.]
LAAAAYQEVLVFEPDFRYAVRGRAFTLLNAGLPFLAQDLAKKYSHMFDDQEHWQFAQGVGGALVDYGEAQLLVNDKEPGYATTDVALTVNTQLEMRFGDRLPSQADRLVALRDRLQMQQVVDLYQILMRKKLLLPPYALAAAADAYLYLDQPEMARDLYLEAIAKASRADAKDQQDWQFSLIKAYSDARQFDAAIELAERLEIEVPPIANRGILSVAAPNPDYARAVNAAALMRLYSDRLDDAEKRLVALRAEAPFNNDFRSSWIELQRERDRPRLALNEISLLQTDDPRLLNAKVSRGEVLLKLDRLTEARDIGQSLLNDYSAQKDVKKLARDLDIYSRPYLKIETSVGRGAANAGAESVTDVSLYSAPLSKTLGDSYRVFTQFLRSNGQIGPEDGAGDIGKARMRLGVGLDYRSQDFRAEIQVNKATEVAASQGFALAMSYVFSDEWQAMMTFDSNVNDLPAAAYSQGTKGRMLEASLIRSISESSKFGAGLSRLQFSDGNTRDMVRAWWMQRWVSGPVFKLASTLNLESSANSQEGRAYFAPERDREASIAVVGEWVSWQRRQRSFKQRLALTYGGYWQKYYGSHMVNDIHYEHEWNIDDVFSLNYGVGRSGHPYDGKSETRNYGYLNLNWRIK